MNSRARIRVFLISYVVVLSMIGVLWGSQAAWAGSGEQELAADNGVALLEAEGQNGVLANSWRYENGRPIEGLTSSEGGTEDGALTAQGAASEPILSAQASYKTHFGIDVSEWEYGIDWGKVAGNVEYAIIRCGYGDNIASQDDKYWLANVKGCQAANIPMGVYIYSYATNTTMAKSEAEHVVRCMKEAGLSASSLALPIYLDMEDNSTIGSDFTAIFNTFKSTMAANGYTNVGVYANCNWWRNYLSGIQLDSHLRWVAHWGVDDPFEGYSDLAAKGYGIWQYGGASVPGISVQTDGNYMNDDAPFLKPKGSNDMYRMYNPNSGEHFYTAGVSERDYLIREGWRYEGVGWRAPASSGTPVFRLYNPYAGDHHYTMGASERDYLVKVGWRYEGIGWYSDDAQTTPLYRLYNPNAETGTHHYTAGISERDYLVKVGWKFEGLGWYAL